MKNTLLAMDNVLTTMELRITWEMKYTKLKSASKSLFMLLHSLQALV